jgi:hypothetical protein
MTLQLVYGYRAQRDNDPYLKLGEHVMDLLANEIASSAKVWAVDVFPFRTSAGYLSSISPKFFDQCVSYPIGYQVPASSARP